MSAAKGKKKGGKGGVLDRPGRTHPAREQRKKKRGRGLRGRRIALHPCSGKREGEKGGKKEGEEFFTSSGSAGGRKKKKGKGRKKEKCVGPGFSLRSKPAEKGEKRKGKG